MAPAETPQIVTRLPIFGEATPRASLYVLLTGYPSPTSGEDIRVTDAAVRIKWRYTKMAKEAQTSRSAIEHVTRLILAILMLAAFVSVVHVFCHIVLNSLRENTIANVLTQLLMEPLSYTLFAAVPGVYLVLRWWQHMGSLADFIEKDAKSILLKYIVVSILLIGAPVGFLLFYSNLSASELFANPSRPATAFTGALERLPTKPVFYALIAGLISFCLAWRWWQFLGLSKEFYESRGQDGHGLTPRDWRVVLGLRKRALSLRTRADLLLAGIFLILFLGIYLVLFILLEIKERDATQAQRIHIAAEFGRELQAMVDGRLMVETTESNFGSLVRTVITQDEIRISTIKQGAQTKKGPWLELKDEEWVTAVLLGNDGKTGMAAGNKGSVFITKDGGETWEPPHFSLEGNESISAVAVNNQGQVILAAGNRGSVFLTRDGGQKWTSYSTTMNRGLDHAAVSQDGSTAVVARRGSFDLRRRSHFLMTTDGGQTWVSPNPPVRGRDRITAVAAGNGGVVALAAGYRGTVHLTADGGQTWLPRNLPVQKGEPIMAVAVSNNVTTVLAAGYKGIVYRTTDGGKKWAPAELLLKEGEQINTVKVNNNTVFAVGDAGSVNVSRDGGQEWELANLPMEEREWVLALAVDSQGEISATATAKKLVVMTADGGRSRKFLDFTLEAKEEVTEWAFDNDGEAGVIAGNKGSFYITTDGGRAWKTVGLPEMEYRIVGEAAISNGGKTISLAGAGEEFFMTYDQGRDWTRGYMRLEEHEFLIASVFDSDGKTGIVAGNKGSVFMTTNAGRAWPPPDLTLREGENVSAVAINNNGDAGVVAGYAGSVSLTLDSGQTWAPLYPDLNDDDYVRRQDSSRILDPSQMQL